MVLFINHPQEKTRLFDSLRGLYGREINCFQAIEQKMSGEYTKQAGKNFSSFLSLFSLFACSLCGLGKCAYKFLPNS